MLGENIRRCRKLRGLSQVELANMLGVSKQSICNWENNNIMPSIEMLVRVAKVFSVRTDFLLDLEPQDSLDVSALSREETTHFKLLIEDLKKAKKKK